MTRIKRREGLEDIPAQFRDSPRPTVYMLAHQKSHAKMRCYPAGVEIAGRIREAEEREDRAERTTEVAGRAVDERTTRVAVRRAEETHVGNVRATRRAAVREKGGSSSGEA
jgi:hypothetical protein